MPRILLLTAETLAVADRDTPLVADALTARGADVRIAPWTSIGGADADGEPPDLVVVRSTWDYTERLPAFLSALAAMPAPVLNPVPVVRWNAHKGYLLELAAAGIPMLPTELVPRGRGRALPDLGAAEIVIKPAVSAGAIGLGRFPAGAPDAAEHLARVTADGDALVQPYLPSIVEGERSLLFLGGEHSHAVRKVPAAGDFRVQREYGGVAELHEPSAEELAVAHASLAAVRADLLYARVDLVGPEHDPLVIELELIEPELFLPIAPGSADRMADAILARCGVATG